MRSTALRFFCL